jgi:hypothetical protein
MANTSDKSEVKRAELKEGMIRRQEMDDLRAVMNTPEGRRFIWRLMGHCRVFGSVWEASAKIHYNAGVQDVGHFLMAETTEADKDLFLQMQKEALEKERVNNE